MRDRVRSESDLHGRNLQQLPDELRCADPVPNDGRVRGVRRRERSRWNHVQRRQRVHSDRYVSIGHVHGRECGRMHGQRSVPYRRELRPHQRNLLESGDREWNRVQRWQCVYSDRYVSVGHVHGRQSGHVHGERPMPFSRDVQHFDGRLLESDEREWNSVQRQQRLYSERYVPIRQLHRSQPRRLRRKRPMSRRGNVQPGKRNMLESDRCKRYRVQRR